MAVEAAVSDGRVATSLYVVVVVLAVTASGGFHDDCNSRG